MILVIALDLEEGGNIGCWFQWDGKLVLDDGLAISQNVVAVIWDVQDFVILSLIVCLFLIWLREFLRLVDLLSKGSVKSWSLAELKMLIPYDALWS